MVQEPDDGRMTNGNHYVIVPVWPDEEQFQPDSLAAQIGAQPIVGGLLR